jgi:uncharacterized peroxidase-related enzyme
VGLRKLLKVKGLTSEEQNKLVISLKNDYRSANLKSADIEMLNYAVKLTRTPSEINSKDIESLRAEGFDDRAIHDICSITAYYAFVNRIADGLGVELEEL